MALRPPTWLWSCAIVLVSGPGPQTSFHTPHTANVPYGLRSQYRSLSQALCHQMALSFLVRHMKDGKNHTDDISGAQAVNSGTGEEGQNLYCRYCWASITNIFLNGIKFLNQHRMPQHGSWRRGSGGKALDLRVFSIMLTPGPSVSWTLV